MNRLQSFFTRYELTTFFVLVYVLSFLCIVCNCITALVIAWKTRFRLEELRLSSFGRNPNSVETPSASLAKVVPRMSWHLPKMAP